MKSCASLIYVATVMLLVCSCSSRPGYVISENKMIDVLSDIQVAQALYNTESAEYNTINKKDELINGVLAKHKITQADLDSSLLWYSDNMSVYKELNDTVAARLRGRSNILRKQITDRTIGQSLKRERLLPSYAYLTDNDPLLSFVVDSFNIKTFDVKNFLLSFDTQGLASTQKIRAGVTFTYVDTLITVSSLIRENSHFSFQKPQVADSLLKSISGYIRLQNQNTPANVMIYNIQYNDSIKQKTAQQKDILPIRGHQMKASKVEETKLK